MAGFASRWAKSASPITTDAWIQRLDEIFFGLNDAPSVEECRVRYLTSDERAKIEKEIQEMDEQGL